MSKIKKLIKKQQLMDRIETDIDSHSFFLNKKDYVIYDMMSEFFIDDATWLVMKRPQKVGIFKRIKPRVK